MKPRLAAEVCASTELPLEALPPIMYIGELAKLTGASPKAIRMYESLGLLGLVSRHGVYRVYRPHHVNQVRLIRKALSLGIRLSALRDSLAPKPGTRPDWEAVALQIDQRRTAISKEVDRLLQVDQTLRDVIRELQNGTETT